MRSFILSVLAAFALTVVARADPFADARAAYDRGDFGTARETFLVLAEMGNAKAQTMMGNIYYRARGVAWDTTVALQWYRKAAAKNEPIAQAMIAQILATPALEGFAPAGTKMMSPAELLALMRASAEQDYNGAEETLALWLTDTNAMPQKSPLEAFAFMGVSVLEPVASMRKDNTEAARWFERAAEHGSSFAQQAIAWRYAKGAGIAPDNAKALFWILLALRAKAVDDPMGFNRSVRAVMEKLRSEVASRLDSSRLSAVEHSAASWQPKPMPDFGTIPETPDEAARMLQFNGLYAR